MVVLVALATSAVVSAQPFAGEVAGYLAGSAHSYQGEFTSDLWGAGGSVSLMYAPLKRLNIEARVGLGEIRWKIDQNDLTAYPDYFGPGATIGGTYPGGVVTIEPENESRITTVDLLLNYVLVRNIPAIPFITAGAGLVNFSPANSEEHEALPNKANEVYSGTAFSVPLGGGVRIPFSDEAGIILRAEHRLTFTPFLDDLDATGMNDGITSVSLGFTYTFNAPYQEDWEEEEEQSDVMDVELSEFEDDEDCYEECIDECCYDDCCHHCCCCCCCCGGGGGAPAAAAPAAAEPGPEPEPAEPAPGPPAEPAARKSFSKDIRFKLNTDEFDFTQPETQQNLQELLTYMKEAPEGHEVIIEGHASSEGPPQRNKVLSDMRARKIREWLEQQGVEKDKIRGTVGYGSSMPKVIEPSPDEAKRMKKEEVEAIRKKNRRIEVHVLKDAYEKES